MTTSEENSLGDGNFDLSIDEVLQSITSDEILPPPPLPTKSESNRKYRVKRNQCMRQLQELNERLMDENLALRREIHELCQWNMQLSHENHMLVQRWNFFHSE